MAFAPVTLNPGGPAQNPDLVNALTCSDLCGVFVTFNPSASALFICPYDGQRTHLTFMLQQGGNDCYVNCLDPGLNGGYYLDSSRPSIEFGPDVPRRIVQSEWYCYTLHPGTVLVVQAYRETGGTAVPATPRPLPRPIPATPIVRTDRGQIVRNSDPADRSRIRFEYLRRFNPFSSGR